MEAVQHGMRRGITGQLVMDFEVPPLSDELLDRLVERIKPVVRQDGKLFYIEPVDPREISFIWDPKITDEAIGLKKIGSIPTLHTWGYYGLFKPSIAEALALIPHTVIDVVRAFEVEGPESSEDLNATWAVVGGGSHLALTTLYA